MGGQVAPREFPVPGGLGQSQAPGVLNQAIAPPRLAANPLLSLTGASYEAAQPALQQPPKTPLAPQNPLLNSPFYGGVRPSQFRPY